MLKGLGLTLLKHNKDVTLYVKGESTKDANGEYVESVAMKSEKIWPSTPISGRQLNLSDAGSFSSEDRNLFQLEPCDVELKFNDEFKVNNTYYVIRDIKDMRDEGGFIRYLGRKKDPQIDTEIEVIP